MKLIHPGRIGLAVILSLALAGCINAAQGEGPHAGSSSGRALRHSLPASSRGAGLFVGVDQRSLPGNRVNLQVHLLPRRVFKDVRVTLTSADPKLAVPPGCAFQALSPPGAQVRRPGTAPLPVIPLCSLVLSAPAAGTYPLDVRVLDSNGESLAPPVFVWVRILAQR